ncbi:hypothetical protein ACFL2Q_00090 [Thermodesulfobacteriota bacterium]
MAESSPDLKLYFKGENLTYESMSRSQRLMMLLMKSLKLVGLLTNTNCLTIGTTGEPLQRVNV